MLFVLHLLPVKRGPIFSGRLLSEHLPLLHLYSYSVNEHVRKGKRSLVTNFLRMSGLCKSGSTYCIWSRITANKAPQKNPCKFPHAGQGRRRSLPFRRSEQCGTSQMCNLKLMPKLCQSHQWRNHLNINRHFSSGEEAKIQGALTKDFPLYIQRNQVLATSLSIFIWCRMLRRRFNKVAQSVSSLVSLQSFHIVSKS